MTARPTCQACGIKQRRLYIQGATAKLGIGWVCLKCKATVINGDAQ